MDLKEQYDRLLRYCYMKTKDIYAAEDITQETFIKFWQSHSYRDTGKEMAYLYTIARNLCTDGFRRTRPGNISDYPDLMADRSTEQESILNGIALEQALDQLPEHLRDIVVMRYMSELSVSDIGKIMGISRFSANRRVKEGLALLKTIMEGGCGVDR